MRAVSLKSLCVLAGFLMPCLGTATRAEAGVIPWMYNSIFGYGWGNYGPGMGGGSPYSVGYGSMGYGYGGSSYGYGAYTPSYAPAYSSYGYGAAPSSCGCSTGISSAPVMSTPTFAAPVNPTPTTPATNDLPPSDGNYNSHYGPDIGYYGYTAGYGPSNVVDTGSCCVPQTNYSPNDCGTSIKSSKPSAEPTPADANPDRSRKNPSTDDFKTPSTGGVGTGTIDQGNTEPADEALPSTEITPGKKPVRPNGGAGTGNLQPPVNSDTPPLGNEHGDAVPSGRGIAVRYSPALKRSAIAVPTSVARVVRVERTARVQTVRTDAQPQLAAKP